MRGLDDVDCYARRVLMSLKCIGRDVVKVSAVRSRSILTVVMIDAECRNGVDETMYDKGEQRSTAFGMVLMKI